MKPLRSNLHTTIPSACAFLVFFSALGQGAGPAKNVGYAKATIDAADRLTITTKDGRSIVPRMKKGQVGFDSAKISSDSRSVGWLELYPNPATSYPIPLALVVRSGARLRVFKGTGLPVWRWQFTRDGKQVAFEQETVHGSIGVHYELHDVASGKLISQYSPPVGPNDISADTRKDAPSWVLSLDSDKQ